MSNEINFTSDFTVVFSVYNKDHFEGFLNSLPRKLFPYERSYSANEFSTGNKISEVTILKNLIKDKNTEIKELEAKNKQQEKLLIEALEYVVYAEKDRYPNTGFTRFLKRAEIKELLKRNEKDENV